MIIGCSPKGQFQIPAREYSQQYSHIYFCRLKQIKGPLLNKAIAKWGPDIWCPRVLDSQTGKTAFLIGTIYVEQPERKGILDEIALEYHLEDRENISSSNCSYWSKESKVFLEDEHGRIELKLPARCSFITGSVVAVMGVEDEDGIFGVRDWTFAGLAPQASPLPGGETVAFLLLSGLKYNLSEGGCAAALHFEMLKDLLVGNLGFPFSVGLEGVVLCGNSLLEPPRLVDETQQKKFGAINYKYDTNHFNSFSRALRQMLEAEKNVVIVPGATDPTNLSLPQQPIHRALFKEAGFLGGKNLYLETNPSLVTINGLLCLIMDGQTVLDAQKHTFNQQPEQIVEYMLRSRHIAPTAPDTLCCYPSYEQDPFVLSASPHVVICGGMGQFKVFWVEGDEGERICVILVPEFSIGQEALCVNFPSLEVMSVKLAFESLFQASQDSDNHSQQKC